MHECESTAHGRAECTPERWQCSRCLAWYCGLHVSEVDEFNLCEACFIEEQRQKVVRIRELNDQFRTTRTGGLVVVTGGLMALGADFTHEALKGVEEFYDFAPDNDPWHEHDFGRFELEGQTILWKIDYYDPAMRQGSEDPSDPEKTARVLTVMLSEDY